MVPTQYLDTFKAVEIIHDDLHRIDYSFLAEFFRFMGAFVCENILIEPHEKSKAEKNTGYGAHIYVGKRNLSVDESSMLRNIGGREYGELISEMLMKEKLIFLYDDIVNEVLSRGKQNIPNKQMLFCLNIGTQKTILTELMKQVMTVGGEEAGDGVIAKKFGALIDIFVDWKLWFHSLNLQYYANRESEVVREAGKAFLSAHDEMQITAERRKALKDGDDVQFIYDYGVLWCEVKTNSACGYCNEMLLFPIEELAKRCRNLCRMYPSFTNAKVLLGLCYEPSANYADDAIWAFKDALQDLKTECYAAPVHYWVGKRFEPYKDWQEDAKKAYMKAYKCKRKFRNCFKLGVFAKKDEKYSEAIGYFEEILSKLQAKRELNLVDPLEIEYLFKAYTQMAYIYNKQNNHKKAIEMGEFAIQVWKTYIETTEGNGNSNGYFKMLYGEEWKRYRETIRKRLKISIVYKILAESYARVMESDKAREYWEKL